MEDTIMIQSKTITVGYKKYPINVEFYDSAMEVADDCRKRPITSSSFDDKSKDSFSESWEGVRSYDEALDYLRNGYQPTVEKLKDVYKTVKSGTTKRFKFRNNVEGFAPIVPLAMMGVPNSMVDMRMTPIKCKVIDIYYDMTCSCGTDKNDIIKAGQRVLEAIMELEQGGYKFNLYGVQSYSDRHGADILCVKIKDSARPTDLKRVSFPLTHTAFFRVIGFDWYSRMPKAKYRGGYGHALAYEFKSKEQQNELARQAFGKNAVFIAATEILKQDVNYLKGVFTNDKVKK